MRYFVALDSEPERSPATVDVVELPNGRLEVRVDGRNVAVDVAGVGAEASVRAGSRMFEVTIAHGSSVAFVRAGDRRWSARVENERSASLDAAAWAPKGGGRRDAVVRSPMPGRVVRVLVAPGQAVAAGQGVVVLEAMKMENEVRAPNAGAVARVHVAAGDAVEANAALITFASEERA